MDDPDLVPLKCSRETLIALASGLSRFGPVEGTPDWLISGVWLCAGDVEFVATSSTEVLGDGYVARRLTICPSEALVSAVEAALPDIEGRLIGRGCNLALPGTDGDFVAPECLATWPAGDYSTTVLVRVAERASTTHRVACGLLFEAGDAQLLVGTDLSSLAMVLSDDEALIAKYRVQCEEFAAADFLDFCEP